MPEYNLFSIFISRLNRLGLNYMVTGAVAGIVYGEPRLTHDLDLVLDIPLKEVERFTAAFPVDEFYCPPPEVIRLEANRSQRGHFNLIHLETGFKADIYTAGRDRLHLWALKDRKRIELEGEIYWLAPAEYVILRKLEYYREGKSEKHLQDINGILAVSSKEINFKLLIKKINDLGLKTYWEKLAGSDRISFFNT